MSWFWLIVVLAVLSGVAAAVFRRKRKKQEKVEKYVCTVCHGTDCDCHRVE